MRITSRFLRRISAATNRAESGASKHWVALVAVFISLISASISTLSFYYSNIRKVEDVRATPAGFEWSNEENQIYRLVFKVAVSNNGNCDAGLVEATANIEGTWEPSSAYGSPQSQAPLPILLKPGEMRITNISVLATFDDFSDYNDPVGVSGRRINFRFLTLSANGKTSRSEYIMFEIMAHGSSTLMSFDEVPGKGRRSVPLLTEGAILKSQ